MNTSITQRFFSSVSTCSQNFAPSALFPLGEALSQLFGFGFPTYGFSLTLRLPIRDRRAFADAMVNKKLDAMRIRSLEQRVRLEVLNAINQAENSKASVELARIARDLAQKRVDADLKRYELGTTTIFFVLASQNDLALAEAALVRESVQFCRNNLTLLQRNGDLLQERTSSSNSANGSRGHWCPHTDESG